MKNVLRSFLLVVGLPTLLAAVYFALIASDQYVSETRFAIRASQGESASGLAGLLTSSVINAGSQDSQVVIDFIESADMLAMLEPELDLSGHYSNPEIDFVARLKPEPTREELLEHYLKHVQIVQDAASETIALRVKAYDPGFAQRTVEKIIEHSESLVNDISDRIEQDALENANAEVALAAEKLKLADQKISEFRSVNASISPAEESSALLGLLSQLESQLTVAKTELSEKRAYMRENTPLVKTLKNKVYALERQLEIERERVAGGDSEGMSGLISNYQPLILDQELAQRQYTSALTSLELARIEAQRKKRYLVAYVSPMLPDESTEPKRILNTLTVFVYAFLAFGIGGLMWSALKDHIGY